MALMSTISVETRGEETGRILQRRAFGEGKLHDLLVGFARADDVVVRPNRIHPLPLLDDIRVSTGASAKGYPDAPLHRLLVSDEVAQGEPQVFLPVPHEGSSDPARGRCITRPLLHGGRRLRPVLEDAARSLGHAAGIVIPEEAGARVSGFEAVPSTFITAICSAPMHGCIGGY